MTDLKKGDSSKKKIILNLKTQFLISRSLDYFFLQENLLNNKETEFYPLRSRTGIFT